ncbi:hypothetical protein I7I53_05653 [Histoplasma capsulatum var. duboisii H88]|uniref:Uncharacterized protein n=1 Tax=Ajellomyces capsulatus (strain H88) TaxID=544711 RepID=A0A8A1LVK4_AJEC8|nr:hypothetical protein I7I53_05653 [Histoplasma capsulatum var. duboisii H88]
MSSRNSLHSLPRFFASQILLRSPSLAASQRRTNKLCLNLHPSLFQNPKWQKHPQNIEKHKVEPQVHRVAGIQGMATGKPLRRKGHESSIQLSDSQPNSHKPHLEPVLCCLHCRI